MQQCFGKDVARDKLLRCVPFVSSLPSNFLMKVSMLIYRETPLKHLLSLYTSFVKIDETIFFKLMGVDINFWNLYNIDIKALLQFLQYGKKEEVAMWIVWLNKSFAISSLVILRMIDPSKCKQQKSRDIWKSRCIFHYHFDIHSRGNSATVFISACLNMLFF